MNLTKLAREFQFSIKPFWFLLNLIVLSIPKVIYQTYYSKNDIPRLARFHIWNMQRMNPEYEYQFFNDDDIDIFIKDEFEYDIYKQYRKLNIGAAKADFFRYAILFKRGGIYLDIDSRASSKFRSWIKNDDSAIITKERNPGLYVQWALIYEKGHSFLKKVLEAVVDNIKNDRYPHDVIKMTGPYVYSKVLDECIQSHDSNRYRIHGVDYNGKIKFKYWLSGFSFRKKEHWRHTQKIRPVLSEK